MNEPLSWYIAGPLLGLMVPLLLVLKEKQFGISSSYHYILSLLPTRISYFNYDRRQDQWQVFFAIGLILSGFVAIQFFGFSDAFVVLPMKKYTVQASNIYQLNNAVEFFIGGILVGFGARYANGCTAGHCIMGCSQFALSSILATICFFIGGLIGSYFVVPQLF